MQDLLILMALAVAPLGVIAVQVALGAEGMLGTSVYKLAFLIPPALYCRWRSLSIPWHILQLRNWRNGLPLAFALGLAAMAIFGLAYAAWGDALVDEATIKDKIRLQFSVTAQTVLLVAPFTIVINSFLEEFFYRGFSFGLLVKRQPWVGYVLPAVVFTVQHVLFIYHWVGWLPLALAIVGLFVLALVLEWLYAATDSIVAPWVVHVFGDVAMMGIAVTMLYPQMAAGAG